MRDVDSAISDVQKWREERRRKEEERKELEKQKLQNEENLLKKLYFKGDETHS